MLATQAVLQSSGDFAKGAKFDGSSDKIVIDSGGGTLTSSYLLISLWFRLASNGDNQRIIYSENGGSGTAGIYLNMAANGAITLAGDNSSGVTKLLRTTTSSGYNDGKWYHLLAQFIGTSGTDLMYIDNVAVTTTGIVASGQVSFKNLVLGYNSASNSEYINGSLAEVFITTDNTGLLISNASDRQKFLKGVRTVNLGTEGQTPYGIQPDYYFSRRSSELPAAFTENKGDNGTYGTSSSLIEGYWNWTGPVAQPGDTYASAVYPPELDTYDDQYFDRQSDGSIIFKAPTSGATTSANTRYTRSELREINADNQDNEADWKSSTGGRLECECRVLEMPTLTSGTSNKTVIGQIHEDQASDNQEMCRLYFDFSTGVGRLFFADDKAGAGTGGTETDFYLKDSSNNMTSIPLGSYFVYVIEADTTGCRVTATYNGVQYTAFSPASNYWPNKWLYFKAGTYNGVARSDHPTASNKGTGQSRVQFRRIFPQKHPHTITSTSRNPTASLSSSLTDPAVRVRVGL